MMKKTHFICAAVLLFCVLLQGCSLIPAGQAQPAGSRMVLQVSVDSLPADEDDARIYTDSEKISAVLAYLDGMTLVQNHPASRSPAAAPPEKLPFSIPTAHPEPIIWPGRNICGKEKRNGCSWHLPRKLPWTRFCKNTKAI